VGMAYQDHREEESFRLVDREDHRAYRTAEVALHLDGLEIRMVEAASRQDQVVAATWDSTKPGPRRHTRT